MDYFFGLYEGESQPVRGTPMWGVLRQLRSTMEDPVRVEGAEVGVLVGDLGVVEGMRGMGGGFGDDLMLDFGEVVEGTEFEGFVEGARNDGFTW